jgi:hypothetical protein
METAKILNGLRNSHKVALTSSPSGDGNFVKPENVFANFAVVALTSSPSGDGNTARMLAASSNSCEYGCTYLFPVRGWKLR